MSDIVIEFFGPPASGKSTLARETASKLDRQGFEVENPFYVLAHEVSDLERYVTKSAHVYETVLDTPTYGFRVVRTLRSTEQETITDTIKNAFNWLFLTDIVRSSNAEITILDQGLLQSAASIRLSAESEPTLATVLEPVLNEPDEYVIVVVDTDRTILQSRLSTRRNNPSRVGSRYSLSDHTAVENALLDDARRVLDTDTVHLVNVQNDREGDLRRNVAKIVEALEQISAPENPTSDR